jgi:hypothetical protein
MKITRVIVYKSEDEEQLVRQLGKSLNDGIKQVGNGLTITVLTVGNKPMIDIIGRLEQAVSHTGQAIIK